MRTAGRIDRNFTFAKRTDFDGRLCRCFLLLAFEQAACRVDRLYNGKQRERHDQKIDDGSNECAIGERNAAEGNRQLRKVLLKQQTEQRGR